MTDLKNGKIDIYGVEMGRHPNFEELETHIPQNSDVSHNKGRHYLKGYGATYILGKAFKPEVFVSDKEPPLYILTPRGAGKAGNSIEAQALRRGVCDKVLAKLLGNPTYKTESCTMYKFPWGEVSAVSHIGPENGCDAGYIVIKYF